MQVVCLFVVVFVCVVFKLSILDSDFLPALSSLPLEDVGGLRQHIIGARPK